MAEKVAAEAEKTFMINFDDTTPQDDGVDAPKEENDLDDLDDEEDVDDEPLESADAWNLETDLEG